MKTHIIIFVAAMLAVGCSHKPDARDAKIAKLETRLSEVEAHCERLSNSYSNVVSIIQQFVTDNAESLSKIEALVKKDQDDMDARWEVMLPMFAALTNSPPRQVAAPRYVPAQPQAPVYATKDGVPLGVYNQIAVEAARRYPTDFDMQVFVIKEQTEAYRKLHQ